ncbi:prominin-2 [Stegastes partitus]|uniref:Prominin-1-A-like n=1 Tax=Stegastes partitus TaxID=144197 RepID=A0A3B4Z4K4_9TELE|nr:PREDICTED: prominin-1-A-like [Stegastes partitus]
MGLCENMRVWRRQGGAAAFRDVVGVMLLLLMGLGSAQSVPPQAACQGAAAPQNLSQPEYEETAKEDTGVGFMAPLVQSFLHTIQPNPFPADLILKFIRSFNEAVSDQEIIKETLVYEVGFLVCIAIGALYIVLMPIVGFFLACCRCCGNCGGKMYQKQTSAIHCRRRTLYWSAFVTTIIILAGNICMFRSNEALKVSVDQSPVELSNAISNINTFLTIVPQQVDSVVNESYRTVDEVTENLQAIGPLLGKEIQGRFRGTLDPALQSVKLLDHETVNTSVQLNNLNSSLDQLQSSMDLIQANVTAVRNHIDQTLSKPECIQCDKLRPELQKLTVDTTVSIPSLNEFQSAVDEVIKADLQSQIDEVEDYFQSIPQRVTNETKDVVQRSKQLLDDIKTQISQVTSDIPLSGLTDVKENLNQLQSDINGAMPHVEKAEDIRWAVGVALCCLILLVVVCNLLGLILGPMGLSPKADPTKRSCTADCGGTFLMMGAGISFLFSWLLMIVVLVLFFVGGNSYTLICQSWSDGQLLKFLDTPGLYPGLELGPTLGLKTDINISDVYKDCEENQPLWTTLHLYEVVNLEELLNVSKYTEQIHQQFENTNITLSSITLLSAEVKNKLSSFSTKAEDFDTTAVTQQMNNISSINLNSTADKLDMLAADQTNAEIQTGLQNDARVLRQIQADIETTIIPQLENLNSTIKILQSTAEKINGTVGEVLSKVGAAQDFLNTNTTQIVKTESRQFLDCQLEYFITYADWANLTITQEVGRCEPVARAVDSAETILCAYMVESLNAFWFSLGWCMIFFIPSIIFSIKLAKYYRRMKDSDVFENHIIMNHIPRAQMKFT